MNLKIAKFYNVLANGDIECTLCPNKCILKDGTTGKCLVRKRVGDKLYSLSYGHSVGFSIDPIEKKPLYHFYPNSKVFSFGTFGCNLGCKFCQNDFLSHPNKIPETEFINPDKIISTLLANKIEIIAFTYNEPNIFIEYVVEIAKLCREHGIKTVAVSNGYINKEPCETFYKYIDAVNIDLKSFNKDFYKDICGAKLEPVLDTILYIAAQKFMWLELTNLVIPTINDDLKTIERMILWILDTLGDSVPIHFTAFHPAFKMKDIPSTEFTTLSNIRNLALNMGLKYVYAGNIYDKECQNTFCKKCKNTLIIRNGYSVIKNNIQIQNMTCPNCNTVLDGYF